MISGARDPAKNRTALFRAGANINSPGAENRKL